MNTPNQQNTKQRWARVPGVIYPQPKRWEGIAGVEYPPEAPAPAVKPLAPVPVALPKVNSLILPWKNQHSKNPHHINYDMARRIRSMLNKGMSWREIAEKEGRNPMSLRKHWLKQFGPKAQAAKKPAGTP